MIECGYRDFPPASWTGVLAPAGTAAAVVDKINAAINAGLLSPEIRQASPSSARRRKSDRRRISRTLLPSRRRDGRPW
jgi:tripartite-type tricarboxylate transporter receptor subunit TctC